MNQKTRPLGVLILAAGLGKRMNSNLPKVLHSICGQPIILHILDRIKESVPGARIGIVVGHGREQVQAVVDQYVSTHLKGSDVSVDYIVQADQKGTGHAALCATQSAWGKSLLKLKGEILVIPGDSPLLSKELFQAMTSDSLGRGVALRLLSCHRSDPTGYGRVVRKGKQGTIQKIVEEKDAKPREKEIQEVAVSIYLFDVQFLNGALSRLSPTNAQGEYYLTDLVAMATKQRKKIDGALWHSFEDVMGINNLWELAQAARTLNLRIIRKFAERGVRFNDPSHCYVDATVQLETGCEIGAGAILSGNTKVASNVVIGPYSNLKNAQVNSDAEIRQGSVIENSKIESGAKVGPYAHLRPDSVVGANSKIGNFVELKKTTIGNDTSVAHLSYLGDAEVGNHVNIGCGFVTCNFDGRVIDGSRKHKTTIEDDVFMGSDCQAIAPITIGQGSYIASGSTLSQNVEPGALAIARSRQVNKVGYARRFTNQKGRK